MKPTQIACATNMFSNTEQLRRRVSGRREVASFSRRMLLSKWIRCSLLHSIDEFCSGWSVK